MSSGNPGSMARMVEGVDYHVHDAIPEGGGAPVYFAVLNGQVINMTAPRPNHLIGAVLDTAGMARNVSLDTSMTVWHVRNVLDDRLLVQDDDLTWTAYAPPEDGTDIAVYVESRRRARRDAMEATAQEWARWQREADEMSRVWKAEMDSQSSIALAWLDGNKPAVSEFLIRLSKPGWLPVVADDEGEGAPAESRYGGRPWLSHDEAWPSMDGVGMTFRVQLDVSRLPEPLRAVMGATGLFQLFTSPDFRRDCGHLLPRVVHPETTVGGVREMPTGGQEDGPPRVLRVIGWREVPTLPDAEVLADMDHDFPEEEWSVLTDSWELLGPFLEGIGLPKMDDGNREVDQAGGWSLYGDEDDGSLFLQFIHDGLTGFWSNGYVFAKTSLDGPVFRVDQRL